MSTEHRIGYDDIDFRINVLYDVVYNKSPSQYTLQPIVKKSIKDDLKHIKMPKEYDPSNIFNGSLEYMGKYNGKYTYKRSSDKSHICTVSFEKYFSLGNADDLGRKEVYNPAIHYILSESVITEKFNHALLPLMFFDMTASELKTQSQEIYNMVSDNNELPDNHKIAVFITEHYFQMETLREYIKSEYHKMTHEHWKVLLFQVLYALSKTSEKMSKFRHNMLNLDSLKLYRKKTGGTTTYMLGSTTFNVPNMGFEIKLSDFTFSSTSDYERNKDTRQTRENPYYDMHYFLSCLYLYLTSEFNEVPDYLMSFINEMIPNRFMPNNEEIFNGLDEQSYDTFSSHTIVPVNILKKGSFFSTLLDEKVESPKSDTENSASVGGYNKKSNIENSNSENIENSDSANISVSPIEYSKIKISELNTKEDGIDYYSLTDDSLNNSKMLAKNISLNKKKSEQYYNKDMIKGSRKIIFPSRESDTMSDNGIFKKAESAHSSQEAGKKSTKHKKRAVEKSSSVESFSLSDTVIELSSKKKSKHRNVTPSSSEISISVETSKSKSKNKSRSSRSDSDTSIYIDSTEKSRKSNRELSDTSMSEGEVNKVNEQLYNLDKSFAEKMKSAPKGYVGLVPDYIIDKLEHGQYNGFGNLNSGLNGPNAAMTPTEGIGMPQMMGNPMMGNPMMGSQMMDPQMMGAQMMDPQMMGAQMMGAQGMGGPSYDQISGLQSYMPTAPNALNGQYPMTGGSNIAQDSVCKFMKNGKVVDGFNKDFFF